MVIKISCSTGKKYKNKNKKNKRYAKNVDLMLSALTTKGKKKGAGRKLLDVMDMFMELMVVIFSWVYTYLQTHHVVYIKYLQLSVCQAYLNRAL